MKAIIIKSKGDGALGLRIASDEEVKFIMKTINVMGWEVINEYEIEHLWTQINFASVRDTGEPAQGTYKG